MIALTYAEAQARSRLIEVLGYHVELDVTGGDDIFESVTVVRFGCRAPGTDTFIEIRPARLRRLLADQLEDLRRSLAVSSAVSASSPG